jgi:hypothetical protein
MSPIFSEPARVLGLLPSTLVGNHLPPCTICVERLARSPSGSRRTHARAHTQVPANHPAGRLPQGRGFLALLATDARAFEEVFVAAFEALDAEWLSQRASYMQFNAVLGVSSMVVCL